MALAIAVAAFSLSTVEAADQAAAPAAAAGDSLDLRIDELIKQLGSPQYTARRAAANEIRKIGPKRSISTLR